VFWKFPENIFCRADSIKIIKKAHPKRQTSAFVIPNSRGWYQGEISFCEIKRQLVSLLLHYKKCAQRWLLGDPYLSPLELRVTFTLMVRAVKPRMCARPPRRDLLIILPPALIETSFRTQQHTARASSGGLHRVSCRARAPHLHSLAPGAIYGCRKHTTHTHSGFLLPPFSPTPRGGAAPQFVVI
jgi:hypothetical protein